MKNRNGNGLLYPMLALMLAFVVAPVPAKADIIYENYSVGGFNWLGGGSGQPIKASSYSAVAVQFTPSEAFTLDQFSVAMKKAVIGTNVYSADARINLVTDAGGKPGTTVLEWWAITSLGTTAAVHTFDSAVHPQLAQSTPYWVAIIPTDYTWNPLVTYDYWMDSTLATVALGGHFAWQATSSAGSWTAATTGHIPALKVEGTRVAAIPEPETYALLLAGLGLLTLVAGRRKVFE